MGSIYESTSPNESFSDGNVSKRADKRFGQPTAPAGLAISPRTAQTEQLGHDASMSDLQAAVGAAMEDLSFGSTLTNETAIPDQDQLGSTAESRAAPELTSRAVEDVQSKLSDPSSLGVADMVERPESTVSAASGSFVSASNSPPLVAITPQPNFLGESQPQYASLPPLPAQDKSTPALPTLQSPPPSRHNVTSNSNNDSVGQKMGENYRYTDHLQLGNLRSEVD